jgi:hypothetical protein
MELKNVTVVKASGKQVARPGVQVRSLDVLNIPCVCGLIQVDRALGVGSRRLPANWIEQAPMIFRCRSFHGRVLGDRAAPHLTSSNSPTHKSVRNSLFPQHHRVPSPECNRQTCTCISD